MNYEPTTITCGTLYHNRTLAVTIANGLVSYLLCKLLKNSCLICGISF
jgi:hypothetical protein